MTYYVYELRDPVTGEARYIGITEDPNSRIDSHRKSPHSAPLRNWIRSLGDTGPRMTIVNAFPNSEEALREESRLIGAHDGALLNVMKQSGCRRSGHVRRYSGMGDRVKSLREQNGMTQRSLAATIGCAAATVAHLERGAQSTVEAELGILLARALNVSVEWLVTGEGNQ